MDVCSECRDGFQLQDDTKQCTCVTELSISALIGIVIASTTGVIFGLLSSVNRYHSDSGSGNSRLEKESKVSQHTESEYKFIFYYYEELKLQRALLVPLLSCMRILIHCLSVHQ